MNKDEGILRWGIPGWTIIIGFLTFAFTDYFVASDSTIYNMVNSALTGQELWRTLVAALLIAAAGIPIGFLNYQIYFYLRWNSPLSKSGLLPPLIVGRKDELQMMLGDLKDKDLELGKPWRDKLLSSSTDHRSSWHYISQLISEAFATIDASNSMAEKHHYYLTMLHSLGASHIGYSFGFLFYLLAKWKLQQINPVWIPIAFLIVIVALALLNKSDYPLNKENPSHRLAVRHWAEVFIASLFFIYAVLNPFYDQYFSFVIPLIICTLIGLYWGVAEEESQGGLWFITLLLVVVTLILRLTSLSARLTWVNWSVILSTLIFSAISLAFLKNRQNTRDALGTLEHYALRRFLEIHGKSSSSSTSRQRRQVSTSQ